MGVPMPLLPRVQSIITPSATDAATSSSDFFRINDQSGNTERIELNIVSHNLISFIVRIFAPSTNPTRILKNNSAQNDSAQVENSLEDNIPKVSMKFCAEQEAYDFYKSYARVKGIQHSKE
jgi:zinc finger SWIM domain-containing protein 3